MGESTNEPSLRIADFLTDGSLAALVHELSMLSSCRVTLHDRDGSRIASAPGTPPWRFEPPAHDDLTPAPNRRIIPIIVDGQTIGTLAIRFDNDKLSPEDRERMTRVLEGLALTAQEFCNEHVEIMRKSSELALLYQLSSLLVEASDLQSILAVAIRSAINVMGADAGLIFLKDREPGTLTLAAHSGVSPGFSEAFTSLPIERIVDHEALKGSVTLIPDLHAEGRAALIDWIKDEGLVGLISVGLSFKGSSLGLLRLYTRRPASCSDRERALLRAAAEQIAAAVAGARLIESERERRQMQRHLALAADIQRRMLPIGAPSIPSVDLATAYLPSLELGGDFYDLIELSGHLGIVVGDVVGKGVPAALLMASVRASLRAHAMDIYHLDDVIARVNKALVRDTRPNEFATVFYAVLDPDSRTLTYCNAGHDPPFILRPSEQKHTDKPFIRTLETGGMVLGVDAQQKYEHGAIQLQPGDVLVAYTDGVNEAMNFDNEKFGRDRIYRAVAEILAQEHDATSDRILNHIIWEVRRFTGLRPSTDDLTGIVMRVR